MTLTAFPIGRWRHDNVILLVFNLTLSLAKDDIPVEVSLWLFDLLIIDSVVFVAGDGVECGRIEGESSWMEGAS